MVSTRVVVVMVLTCLSGACGDVLGIEQLPHGTTSSGPGAGGAGAGGDASTSSIGGAGGTGGAGGAGGIEAGAGGTGGTSCVPEPNAPCHLWSLRVGDEQSQVARHAVVDGDGNVFVTGCFEGNVDFGGEVLESDGEYDGYLAKYDGAGELVWALRFGDAASSYPCWYGMQVDEAGDVLLAGSFAGTVNFNEETLQSKGAHDVFVAKFDSAGQPAWSRAFGDSSNQEAHSVAADADGNVIVVGDLAGTVDFGDGPRASFDAEPDPFLIKLDSEGNTLWSQIFANAENDHAYAVATDEDGAIVVTGGAEGTVAWGGEPLPELGDIDLIIGKYDAAGNHLWSKRFGSAGNQVAGRLAVEPAGSILVTAIIGNSVVDFGGGAVGGTTASVLVRLDTDGEWLADAIWSYTRLDDVAAAPSGAIYLAGAYKDSAAFDDFDLTLHGEWDAVMVRLDAALEPEWIFTTGGPDSDYGRGVGVSADGAFLFGSFELFAELGGGVVVSEGHADLFLVKYSP